MPSDRYIRDDDCLPADLAAACRQALGGAYAVVSVRAAGEMSDTEQRLGEFLVDRVREATGRPCRVYFGGVRRRTARRQKVAAIQWLLDLGHATQAVADALGLRQPEVSRAGKAARPQGQNAPAPEYDEAAYLAGLAALGEKWGDAAALDPVLRLVYIAGRMGVTPTICQRRALAAGHACLALRNAL
jgi:hypothetical protein